MIAYDNSTPSGSAASPSTYSHTVSAGANRILFVGVVTGGASDRVTGVTYNGVAMTRVPNGTTNTTAQDFRTYLYYLIAPASGANDVVVTFTGGGNARSVATSYTGAKQSGVPDAEGTNTSESATSLSKALTTVLDNCWIAGFGMSGSSSNTAGANTTVRGISSYVFGFDTNGAQTPAGSHSTEITQTPADVMMMCTASFAPAVDVTATPSVLAATFSLPASVISLGATIAAGVQSIVASLQAIAVSLGVGISPAPLEATFSIPAPNILTPDALIQPSPLVATFSLPSSQVNLDMVLAMSVLTATFSSPGASVEGIALISPGVLAMTFSHPVSQINLDMVIAVATQEITATIPGVTVIPEIRMIAGVQVLTLTIPTPAILLEAIVSPSPVELYLSINSPFVKSTQYGRKYTVQGDSYGVKYI